MDKHLITDSENETESVKPKKNRKTMNTLEDDMAVLASKATDEILNLSQEVKPSTSGATATSPKNTIDKEKNSQHLNSSSKLKSFNKRKKGVEIVLNRINSIFLLLVVPLFMVSCKFK